MKNIILFIAFTIAGFFAIAQNTAKDVFTNSNMVWCGLDFSKSRMIGAFDLDKGTEHLTGNDIKTRYTATWNMLILNEPKKYEIGKAFHKTSVVNDISITDKSNLKIDENQIMTNNEYKFENAVATIEEIIKSYEMGDKKDGIGLVFIVEYFNKEKKQASVYVTLFDIATKNVLFTEKMLSEPSGFGIRNYWAGSIARILKQIEGKTYKSWKEKYGK